MRAQAAIVSAVVGLTLAACSIREEVAVLPCPCAPGFVCFLGRCVREGGSSDGSVVRRDSGTVRDGSGREDAELPVPFEVIDESFVPESSDCAVIEGLLTLGGSATECTHTSRVFEVPTEVSWQSIEWLPLGPYGKRLPGEQREERQLYRDGAVSMQRNRVLLRMDEPVALSTEMPIQDYSGNDTPCIVYAESVSRAQPDDAPFGSGLRLDARTSCVLLSRRGTPLDFGTDDFTWALWVRTSQPAEGAADNRVFIGGQSESPANPHFWFGLRSACNGTTAGATLGGTLRSSAGDDAMSYCGRTEVNDGEWHHVALVKRGHTPARIEVYLDGRLESSTAHVFNGSLSFRDPSDLMFVSGFPGSATYDADAAMADLAIFERALDPEEIANLARRLQLAASLEVRTCARPDCGDAEFVGPLGPGSVYTDDMDGEPPPIRRPIEGMSASRYVQYRVHLRGTPNDAPRIAMVMLRSR